MKEHTDRQYEADLHRLRQDLLLMGGKVEQMISSALRAFETRDAALAEQTIAADLEVNRMELDTDELCLRVLALRQPAASDLRFITIALKIDTDLERIGDLAVNVAERAQELCAVGSPGALVDLKGLGTLAQGLLRDALDAFVVGDVRKAEEVLDRDRVLDARYAEVLNTLIASMCDRADALPYATRALAVAKYLERIGDHAKNIAEMVVFMVKGQDIRHMSSRTADEG
jgi:phosphate transport system protein